MAGLQATEADRRIGARIQAARRAARLSQRAVAKAVGVSAAQFQKYEKGTNRISASTLQNVAHMLDLPVARFFDPRPERDAAHMPAAQALRCSRRIAALDEEHGTAPDTARCAVRIAQDVLRTEAA